MNRMFVFLIMMISFLMMLTGPVLAQTTTTEVREFFNGTRMMGMGGASIAVVNDETALLSNPAGLGKLRDMYGTLIDPEIEGNANFYPIYSKSGSLDFTNIEKVKPALDQNLDTYYHAKTAFFPSFVVRNFGIGLYWRKVLDAYENAAGTEATINYYDDMALVLGYNFRFFDGRVKLGFNGKVISRIAVENVTQPATSAVDLATIGVEGVAVGSDVGLTLTAPWKFLPTISAVVRDAGGTVFNAGSGIRLAVPNRPSKIEQDIDVAVALFPIHSNSVRSTFTFEYQKIKAAQLDTDKTKYYHAGVELNMSDLFFLRAGMNQRYWTAGMELASERVQMQFATFGEDIGTSGSPVEDRRYMFKFAFRF